MSGWLKRLRTKSFDQNPHVPHLGAPGDHGLTDRDIRHAVREGFHSNVLMAPIQWIMRAFPEADAIVERKVGADQPWKHQDEHPLEALLRRPNDGYDGACLWQATSMSYTMNGNAYWLKRRNVLGEVVELWYVPHWMIFPRRKIGSTNFIDFYEYFPLWGQPAEILPPSEIVHLRFGIDPRNPMLGWSQIGALTREIFTDEQASAFSATILTNMGVPGLVVSPKTSDVETSPEDVKEMKAYLDSSHTDVRRGKAMVFSTPTDVVQFGFDPNKLQLSILRDLSEERVCAMLGLPAAVVGFGAGLSSTKVGATMREMRRLAWVQCIIPMQDALGRQVTQHLLPEFESMPQRWRVRFDTRHVSAFQEEATEAARRLSLLVGAGIMQVSDAQEEAGIQVDASQKLYLRPNAQTAVKQGDSGIAPAVVPPPPAPTPPDPNAPPVPPTPPAGKDLMVAAADAVARLRERAAASRNGNPGT